MKSQTIPTRRWLSALFELPSFRKAPATAVRVLLVLVRHRNRSTGLTYPLQSTIARTLGIHRQSVTRAIKWLVKNDIIVRERLRHEGRTRKVCRLPFLDELENQGSATAASVAAPALRALQRQRCGALKEGFNSGVEVGAAEAPTAADCEAIKRALTRAHIGKETQRQLLADQFVTAEIVERRLAQGKSTAITISDIRADADAARLKHQDKRATALGDHLLAASPDEHNAIRQRFGSAEDLTAAGVPDDLLFAAEHQPVVEWLLNGAGVHD